MTHGTSFDFNGDLPMGMPITFGVQNAEHEAKDWANSRFLLLVGSNPVETRIPDVHFLFDAIERGARLVVIDPSFSPTAAKADAAPAHQSRHGCRARAGTVPPGDRAAASWTRTFMRTFTGRAAAGAGGYGQAAPGDRAGRRGTRPRVRRLGPRRPRAAPRRHRPARVRGRRDAGARGQLQGDPRRWFDRGCRARVRARASGAGDVDTGAGIGGHGHPGRAHRAARAGVRFDPPRRDPDGWRVEPLVPRRPHRARVRAPGDADRQHRTVGRRLLGLRRAVQGARGPLAVVEPGRHEGEGLPVDLLRARPHGHDASGRALPRAGMARPGVHVRQHVRPVDGRQPAPRDARRPGPHRGRRPPDDRDRALGGRGPARHHLV